MAEVRRAIRGVAVAESGHLDLHRRAEIGVAVVSSTAAHAAEVLDACERLVAARPEIELLSARQRLLTRRSELTVVDQARARKLADRIAQIVAEMLERRIKDPAAGLRHHHRRPGHRRPARGDGLLHRLRLDEAAQAAPRPRWTAPPA